MWRSVPTACLRVAAGLPLAAAWHTCWSPPAFLAPVGPETPLYTGTADTATINSGVVYILGDPAGGEGSSVACIWCGDED